MSSPLSSEICFEKNPLQYHKPSFVTPIYELSLISGDVGVQVSQDELKTIADTMKNNPQLFNESGIHLGGEKYFCLSAESTLVRGRKGGSALIVVATNTLHVVQAMIIMCGNGVCVCEAGLLVATTIDTFPVGKLNIIVEKLGDYLRANNY
ncbi:hypothetical protein LAZ67_15002544 [Cordylochernes scorpioides]|uniref:Profilin n=1 Tax=Cordylochernes scorpioides TaxID=51811 RepID=A0ABY6LDS8_9ARAC|nr:hypothetical protein LAZ67_15002544 [Cordylochernes scorpioides]